MEIESHYNQKEFLTKRQGFSSIELLRQIIEGNLKQFPAK
jgi:hypothetical protein